MNIQEEHQQTNQAPPSSSSCNICGGAGFYRTNGRLTQCKCQLQEQRSILRKYSGLPAYTRRPLLNISRNYIANYAAIRKSGRSWLAFLGKSGTGKSTQAFEIADALLNKPSPVQTKVFVYSDILQELVSLRFDGDRFYSKMNKILGAELLVIDDFLDVIPRQDSFEEQVAVMLIKRRYTQRMPLILTSELTPVDFQNHFPRHGEAIAGRIFEMADGRVSVAGEKAVNYRFAVQS